MSMIGAVKAVLSKYASFGGRARRSEYWWFYLAFAILGGVLDAVFMPMALGSIDMQAGTVDPGYFTALTPVWLLSFGLLLPSLAVTVRRLHDTNRSGGWIFISLVPLVGGIWLIVLLATAGTAGPNRFGADPKGVAPVAPAP